MSENIIYCYSGSGHCLNMAKSIAKRLGDTDIVMWKDRGVQQGKEYAILTDELTRAWSGMTTRQYKSQETEPPG